MLFEWYVCPYDVFKPGDVNPNDPDSAVFKFLTRVPAIARYIPVVPNADGANWDEAEILRNWIVVKVQAPGALHAQIQADADFIHVPRDVSIPPNLRNKIKKVLGVLGYTDQEISDTGWVTTQLLALLTTARSNWRKNATGNGIDLLLGRRVTAKLVSDIEKRLPG